MNDEKFVKKLDGIERGKSRCYISVLNLKNMC